MDSGQFKFKLESTGSVVLTLELLQVSPHLDSSLGGWEVQDEVGFDRFKNSRQELGILGFPLGVQILIFVLVRSRVVAINMAA